VIPTPTDSDSILLIWLRDISNEMRTFLLNRVEFLKAE
jgi:hypothetical protein